MTSNRGYSLDHGAGQKKNQPKRARCQHCGKLGLGKWECIASPSGRAVYVRLCRYCQSRQTRSPR